MLHVRIIGSSDCVRCDVIRNAYTRMGLEHQFMNADLEEHKHLLDDMSIDDLPVIQIIDDDGKVHYSHVASMGCGGVPVAKLRRRMELIILQKKA